jgi:hypothetical protein
MRVLITVFILLLTGLSFSLLAVSPSGGRYSPATGPGDTLHRVLKTVPRDSLKRSQDSDIQADPTFCSGLRNTAFQAGEVLTYRVYYAVANLSIAAGEASFTTTLEISTTRDVYHRGGGENL